MARSSNPEQNPTLRARRLALELLRRREAAGLTREEAARQLEWSTSTIFRIETGRSRPQPGNVRVLLELYGVSGPERDGLIRLAREARQPGWWHSFRDVLPNPYEVFIGLEAGAASIRNFEPIVIPGLLQTEEYARQTLRNGPGELDRDDIERLVQVRMERQRILGREDRPRLWAVID
jgi:transcriptional regulator with XRE-family HTH domain